jgi:hypothetical protein
MIFWLVEPSETWFGAAVLLVVVLVVADAVCCWNVQGRMDFLLALLKPCPADQADGDGALR